MAHKYRLATCFIAQLRSEVERPLRGLIDDIRLTYPAGTSPGQAGDAFAANSVTV